MAEKPGFFGRLANPTFFLKLSGAVLPWLTGLTVVLMLVGLYLVFFVAPADYQQGETVKIMFIHVPSAWLAMMGYSIVTIASIGSSDLAPSHGRCRRQGGIADRRVFHAARADYGITLGQADVGNLLGLGRPPDVGADPVLPLSRPDGALAGHRGAVPRRPGCRDSRHRRDRSICRSSSFPSTGGTRCISRRRSPASTGPRYTRRSWSRFWSWRRHLRRCSSCCI